MARRRDHVSSQSTAVGEWFGYDAGLPVEIRRNPVASHAEWVRDADEMGLFWDATESGEDAVQVVALLDG
ncbi:MAG TPA: hypothetical protein VES73_18185 [Lamprocystis sp. (in: g-proteobacteria)]|nr:hypothetical protein [Lamprocystis sp. (in: g-proteobacteria)]